MTKMVRKTRGWGVNFWASENWSGRVHFEGHSPEWRVLSKLSVQPCDNKDTGQNIKSYKKVKELTHFGILNF